VITAVVGAFVQFIGRFGFNTNGHPRDVGKGNLKTTHLAILSLDSKF
jgi:hypothetical protein